MMDLDKIMHNCDEYSVLLVCGMMRSDVGIWLATRIIYWSWLWSNVKTPVEQSNFAIRNVVVVSSHDRDTRTEITLYYKVYSDTCWLYAMMSLNKHVFTFLQKWWKNHTLLGIITDVISLCTNCSLFLNFSTTVLCATMFFVPCCTSFYIRTIILLIWRRKRGRIDSWSIYYDLLIVEQRNEFVVDDNCSQTTI